MTALEEFVAAVDAAGGVRFDPQGIIHPRGDPEWTDLGAAYVGACEELGRRPQLRRRAGDDLTVGELRRMLAGADDETVLMLLINQQYSTFKRAEPGSAWGEKCVWLVAHDLEGEEEDGKV